MYMSQLRIDFGSGTRICIVCKNEVNETWAKARHERQPNSENWVCSNCWNNMHYTTRLKMMDGSIDLNGLFRHAKKTQSKKLQTKTV